MGGMFTILKVRDAVTADTAASWHEHPEGTLAVAATRTELERDGIQLPNGPLPPAAPTGHDHGARGHRQG